MSGALHTRLPRTLGTSPAPRQHFRLHEETGGICLNVPVHASQPGQLTAVRGDHFILNVVGEGSGDEFLAVNEDGAINIRIE